MKKLLFLIPLLLASVTIYMVATNRPKPGCLKNGEVTDSKAKCCSNEFAEAPTGKDADGNTIYGVRCAPKLGPGQIY